MLSNILSTILYTATFHIFIRKKWLNLVSRFVLKNREKLFCLFDWIEKKIFLFQKQTLYIEKQIFIDTMKNYGV